MEEYLTVKELAERIKFSKQSIYNLIHKEVFVLGEHYLKPTPKKVLFKWMAIKSWMGESCNLQKQSISETTGSITSLPKKVGKNKPSSLIKI